MRLRNIKAIARKEYFHLIRDFRSLYLAFFIPLLLILLFGYALSLDVENIRTVVVDHDNTPASRDFVRKLNASVYFKIIDQLAKSSAAIEAIDRNKAILAIVIPPGWTADLKSDRKSPLQVIIDGSDPNFAGSTRAYITAFISQTNQNLLVDFLNRQGMEKIEPPVEGRIRVWFNEDLESRNFIVPGIIALIIMIVGALLTSLVVAREYENGTMETIRSLPVQAVEFLTGKALPYFIIALVDVLVAILMGQVLFGVVMKSSFWLMIMASCVYLGVALGVGLLISTLTKSQLVANQMAILVTYLPSLLLSNFVFPRENMPEILKLVTYIIPATYYIDILNGLYLRHLNLSYLWPSYLILLLMFLFLVTVNMRILKREGL
ncbi:MAG: ABC transporter permease [Desulfobacterales bacterium]